MNTPQLETERLLLRKFTQADMEALYLLLKDEEVNTFLPWFPLKSLEETRAFYEERIAVNDQKDRAYFYAICLKEYNDPIGYIKADMMIAMISVMHFGKNFGIEESLRKQAGLL